MRREARIAAELSHPNIAKVIRTSDENGVFCIASEFVPGVDLDTVISALAAEARAMSSASAATIVLAILEALVYAHDATGPNGPLKLVHRDLSAGNVMLTFSGNVKIIDFGVAHADIDDFKTGPGALVGTLRSLSPEQARGEPVDKRSDLYAVGVLLYELLTCQPLQKTESPLLAALEEIAHREPPSVSEENKTVPPDLDAVVKRALAQKADERYQDAQSFASELRHAVPEPAAPTVLKDILSYIFPEIRQRWARLEERARDVETEVGFEPSRRVSTPDWLAISQVSELGRDLLSNPVYFPATTSDVLDPPDLPMTPEEEATYNLSTDMLTLPEEVASTPDWLDPTDLIPSISSSWESNVHQMVVPADEAPTGTSMPAAKRNASYPDETAEASHFEEDTPLVHPKPGVASQREDLSSDRNPVFRKASIHELTSSDRTLPPSGLSRKAVRSSIDAPDHRSTSAPSPKLGFREGVIVGLVPTFLIILWALLR